MEAWSGIERKPVASGLGGGQAWGGRAWSLAYYISRTWPWKLHVGNQEERHFGEDKTPGILFSGVWFISVVGRGEMGRLLVKKTHGMRNALQVKFEGGTEFRRISY